MSNKDENESFHEEGSEYLGYQPQEEPDTRGNRGRGNRAARDYK